MPDVQQQDRVVSEDGQNYRGVTSTTQTLADPVTGASMRTSSTRMWSGESLWIRTVGLIAAVVVVLLALDFVLHATGAANIGFGAFIFSLGTFLAAPFAGIFKTAYATQGNLLVWADLLAIAIYALAASLIAKVVSLIVDGNAKRAVA